MWTSRRPPLIGILFAATVFLVVVTCEQMYGHRGSREVDAHENDKPLPIKNISCISDNWASLTCNWTKPENPVITNYTIFFRLPGRAGSRQIISCPKTTDITENTCYWDLATEPIYRQPYEYYYFTLTGTNEFGSSKTHFLFHHYANIIPASPTDVTVVDTTHSSAILRWSVGPMALFPKGLIHKIEYKSQCESDPEHWHSANVTDILNCSSTSKQSSIPLNCQNRGSNFNYFNVTGLQYLAYYDFRIYVRTSIASGEDKWSAPGCITLKTKFPRIRGIELYILEGTKTDQIRLAESQVGMQLTTKHGCERGIIMQIIEIPKSTNQI